MKTSDFSFNVPEHLIAQRPLEKGKSRLLIARRNTQTMVHEQISSLPGILPENCLVVFNNTKVRKARLYAVSPDGGRVEFLLLRSISESSWEALVSRTKRQRKGKRYEFPEGVTGEIVLEKGNIREVRFSESVTDEYLERNGHMPLPPYIKRESDENDDTMYQTVFADRHGSVAAPTAGLHFTGEIISGLKKRGIEIAEVTLHVGIGTFLPIRAENIEDHKMHAETYEITEPAAEAVSRAKKESRPVIAVGTTSVRTLESAWSEGRIKPGTASTELYIYPGYDFHAVDGIITNFHTPESSLFVMISSFAGLEFVKKAYTEAIEKEYRFFSYGDAMYIF